MGEKQGMLKQKQEEYAIKQILGSDERGNIRAALWNHDEGYPPKQFYPLKPIAAVATNDMIDSFSLSSSKRAVTYVPEPLRTLSNDINTKLIQGSVYSLYEHAKKLAEEGPGIKKKFKIYIIASNEEEARKVAQDLRDAYGIKYSISNPQRLDKKDKLLSSGEKKLLKSFERYSPRGEEEENFGKNNKFNADRDRWRFRTDHIEELTGDLYPFKTEEGKKAPAPAAMPVPVPAMTQELSKAMVAFLMDQKKRFNLTDEEILPIREQIPSIAETAGYDEVKMKAALTLAIKAYLEEKKSKEPGVFSFEMEYDPQATEKEWSENLDKRLSSMSQEQLKAREKEIEHKNKFSDLDRLELSLITKRIAEFRTKINAVSDELEADRKKSKERQEALKNDLAEARRKTKELEEERNKGEK